MAAADGLCLPSDPDAVWSLEAPPCRGGRRPVAEALEDADFRGEVARRWSIGDQLADDASIDGIKANDHFFAIFAKLRLVQGNLAELLAAARSLAARSGVIYLETASAYVPDPGGAQRPQRLGPMARRSGGAAAHGAGRPAVRGDPRRERRGAPPRGGAVGSAARVRRARAFPADRDPDPGAGGRLRERPARIRDRGRQPLVVGINVAGPETHAVSVRDYDLHMRMRGGAALPGRGALPLRPAGRGPGAGRRHQPYCPFDTRSNDSRTSSRSTPASTSSSRLM